MRLTLFITCLLAATSILNAQSTDTYTVDVEFKNVPDSVCFTLGSNDDAFNYKQKVYTSGNRLHFDIDIAENHPIAFYLIGKNPSNPKKDVFITRFFGAKGIKHKITSHREGFAHDSVSYSGAPWDMKRMEIDNFQSNNVRQLTLLRNQRTQLHGQPTDTISGIPIYKVDSVTSVNLHANMDQIMRLQDEYHDYTKRFITENPDSPDALQQIGWHYKDFTHEELESFASRIPDSMKGGPDYETLQKILSFKIIASGDKLADYDLVGEDINGVPIKLSQFTTPYIIVDFNSLGCGACRAAAKLEIPEFIKNYGNQVSFVSYSTDDSRKSMEKAHQLDKATWPTIWEGKRKDDTCLKYGVTGYPTFFIFGPDRTLLHTWSGWGPTAIERNFQIATGQSHTAVAE